MIRLEVAANEKGLLTVIKILIWRRACIDTLKFRSKSLHRNKLFYWFSCIIRRRNTGSLDHAGRLGKLAGGGNLSLSNRRTDCKPSSVPVLKNKRCCGWHFQSTSFSHWHSVHSENVCSTTLTISAIVCEPCTVSTFSCIKHQVIYYICQKGTAWAKYCIPQCNVLDFNLPCPTWRVNRK